MAKTILIVEDDELNLKLFTDLFQSKGYRTLQATDGRDAVTAVRRHRPDLVLMDIQLPGMSGLNATAEIKSDDDENIRDIPIIAVTAYATTNDEARARSAGCESYVAKPVSVYKLLEMVTGFIGLAGSD